MKKTILILAVILSVITASAQKFGITGGLNVSEQINHSLGNVSYDWKTGFQAGVFMDYSITPKLSLIPELSFAQKGMQIKANDLGVINLSFV